MTDDLTDVEREVSGGWAFVAWLVYLALLVTLVWRGCVRALRLVFAAVLGWLAALVTYYTVEYFTPYKGRK